MASTVLTIPDEVRSELKRFSWVNWSELAREELLKQEKSIRDWKEFERIVSKSKLTQEQADKLADEASWALAKRYEKFKGK
jgi:hypothetical protein